MSETVGRLLITGGAGYFGSVLADRARAEGHEVRIFDLNPPEDRTADHVVGDVRDLDALRGACDGVDAILHNVAQVPLAKDRELFWSVNVVGTANVLLAARDAKVAKVVHTSSSAIFGIPESNPVVEDTPPHPLEAYGKAKLEGELLCHDAAASGLDVSIVRPRTVLGHGRLGIMAILFEFVADGAPVFVLGKGDNRYQFVHADDLADACLRAAQRPGAGDVQHRVSRLRHDARDAPGARRPRRHRLARGVAAGEAGPGRDEGAGPVFPDPVRAVPLAPVRRVPVVRREQGGA